MVTAVQDFPTIKPRPEFAGILKQQETFATGDVDDPGEQINSWFDKLLLQTGAGISPMVVVMLCITSAILFGGLMYVIQENLLTTAILGMIGFIVPIGVLMGMRARRQQLILSQMPLMADGLARASRTGRSMEQCISFVAGELPSPLGDEVKLCSSKLEMGLPMQQALSELPERTGVNSLRILTTALGVHQQTGGDVSRVLERMGTTLRDRLQFLGRLRAATAASRATAILMMVIPPLVLIFFMFRDSNYLTTLTNSSWGRFSLMLAIGLQVVGAIWTLRVLQTSKRT